MNSPVSHDYTVHGMYSCELWQRSIERPVLCCACKQQEVPLSWGCFESSILLTTEDDDQKINFSFSAQFLNYCTACVKTFHASRGDQTLSVQVWLWAYMECMCHHTIYYKWVQPLVSKWSFGYTRKYTLAHGRSKFRHKKLSWFNPPWWMESCSLSQPGFMSNWSHLCLRTQKSHSKKQQIHLSKDVMSPSAYYKVRMNRD